MKILLINLLLFIIESKPYYFYNDDLESSASNLFGMISNEVEEKKVSKEAAKILEDAHKKNLESNFKTELELRNLNRKIDLNREKSKEERSEIQHNLSKDLNQLNLDDLNSQALHHKTDFDIRFNSLKERINLDNNLSEEQIKAGEKITNLFKERNKKHLETEKLDHEAKKLREIRLNNENELKFRLNQEKLKIENQSKIKREKRKQDQILKKNQQIESLKLLNEKDKQEFESKLKNEKLKLNEKLINKEQHLSSTLNNSSDRIHLSTKNSLNEQNLNYDQFLKNFNQKEDFKKQLDILKTDENSKSYEQQQRDELDLREEKKLQIEFERDLLRKERLKKQEFEDEIRTSNYNLLQDQLNNLQHDYSNSLKTKKEEKILKRKINKIKKRIQKNKHINLIDPLLNNIQSKSSKLEKEVQILEKKSNQHHFTTKINYDQLKTIDQIKSKESELENEIIQLQNKILPSSSSNKKLKNLDQLDTLDQVLSKEAQLKNEIKQLERKLSNNN